MALNNRIVHNVFRTITYTKRIDFQVIFLTRVGRYFEGIKYRCHYLLTITIGAVSSNY
jgi:hypothetical protein